MVKYCPKCGKEIIRKESRTIEEEAERWLKDMGNQFREYCPDCGTELKKKESSSVKDNERSNQWANYCAIDDYFAKFVDPEEFVIHVPTQPKEKPRTNEEEIEQWLDDPENRKKYEEACAYFHKLSKSKPVDADKSINGSSPTNAADKNDGLSIFYYKENSDGTITITGLKDKNISEIVIPYNAVAIGEYAFATCSKLKKVTIGSKVTSIGQSAFFECSNLTTINIPNRESISDLHPTNSY